MQKLFTLTEAAHASGYNDQHLRKLCRERKINFSIRGNRYFFTVEELEGLVRHVVVSAEVEKIEKRELKKEMDAVKREGLLGGKKRRGGR